MSNYSHTDFYWDILGDIEFDPAGDVLDTETDNLRSLVQEVRTRVSGESKDWGMYPRLKTLDVKDYLGQPNTNDLATRIKDRIVSILTYDSLVMRGDLVVLVAPASVRSLAIRLAINCTGTPGIAGNVDLRYVYNTKERELIAL